MKKMDIKNYLPALTTAIFLIFPLYLNARGQGNREKNEWFDPEVSIASQLDQKISEAPGIVSVITAEEIERLGARDLRDVLRLVPGFEIGMRDIGYTQIGIRGVITPNSEKVKILVDDIPINEHVEGAGTIIFGEMPLDNISRIEILRGPGSSLYGGNAFAGVINIITKKAEEAKGVNITLKGGSFNTREAGLLLGKSFKDFKINAYFNYYRTDGQQIPIEEDILTGDPVNGPVSLAGTAAGHTVEGRKRITTTLNLRYKDFYLKGLFLDSRRNHYYTPRGALVSGCVPRGYQLNGMLGYKFKIDEKIRVEPRLYMIVYKSENLWEVYPPGYRDPVSGFSYPHGQFEIHSLNQKTFGLDVRLTYRIIPGNTLIIKTSFERIKSDDSDIYSNVGRPELTRDNLAEAPGIMKKIPSRRVFSGFIQDQWNISENVSLTVGMRYDNYDDVGTSVNPRFAFVFRPLKRTAVKLLFGQAFRPPTFVELYAFFSRGFLGGNIDNYPETVKTAELEFSYDFAHNGRFKINFFTTSINELIQLKPFFDHYGVLDHLEYRNIDAETVVQGIETEMKFLLGGNGYGFINYSYQRGKNKKTGAALAGMAHHILNAGLNLELWKHLNLNINATMVGPRKREVSDPGPALNGYTLVNATLMKRNLLKNMKLFVSVYNLFNADCRVPDPVGNIPNDFPLPNSARSFILGLNYSF
jgi:iron complex outermembrane receptor protein